MSSKLTIDSTVRLSTGYEMPLLGFGVFQNSNAKESVVEAFKAGYRHVDSAQLYGNEAQVAEAVRASGLDRNDVFITTKCVSRTHGYESTKKELDESLAKMKFDYIDLFLIHDPLSGKQRRLETYKALLEGRAAGKIRTVGVSNYGIHHIEEIKAAGYELPAVNQVELHPLCQQKEIVKYCKENSIVVQAYCPIIRGQTGYPIIHAIAAKHDRDPAQILIRWSLQKGHVFEIFKSRHRSDALLTFRFIPLPKSATPSRIRSNAEVYDFELNEDDMQKLDSLDRGKNGAISWNPVEAP
ncbi:NADP-dependent oxidoreductase domain-containing protein [Gymnopilus junonius]|uniref:NADP-dependent oxidoreductase domain-containing protein n=1 Tax=Gymnopilus junonius TaxID=109634 RepID=A0A9P5NRU1_GYMJU|nr:NADP-dependent oxidoreductase domain-containing protein [Gymnopilus junonius]